MSIKRKLNCTLIGAPVDTGASQLGCLMGPDAYRTAGLANTLSSLGHEIDDIGNLAISNPENINHPQNANIKNLAQTRAWSEVIKDATFIAKNNGKFPILLGGDHSIAIGSVAGVTKASKLNGRPQFLIWLDAHPDIHDLETTSSGNLHGTPISYLTGLGKFDDFYPPLEAKVEPDNILMMGIRSVDTAENEVLIRNKIEVYDMRAIDERGVLTPLRKFIDRVRDANGELHVSLDVDFLEPQIAPAVGTTVPGGATFREAHLIMETLCDSELVTSLDLVELNPFLDERGRTTRLMVDLCASLMGRRVLDRLTRSY